MQVILKEDFAALGYIGDTVSVRRGYARNYLIPRGIALEVSGSNSRVVKHYLTAIASKRAKLKAEAEALSKQISTVVIEFTLKMGERGRAFGSITAKDVVDALAAKGHIVDRRRVKFGDAIRAAGDHTVFVKLHAEVSVPVTVRVLEEKVVAAKDDGDEGKAKRRRGGKKAKAVEGDNAEAAPEGESASPEKTAE